MKFKPGDRVFWDVWASGALTVGTPGVFHYGTILEKIVINEKYRKYKILRKNDGVSIIGESYLKRIEDPNEILKELL
jgi:hypothetical protein